MEHRPNGAAVNLDAYFERINYDGLRTPTLATLRALIELHPAAIPFEAIDAILGRGIDLDPAVVEAKLVDRLRGGYCFEQNGLLKRVLKELGFDVQGLIARVLWMQPPDALPTGWGHMALKVRVDNVDWLVDVGFGTCVPTSPLRFDLSDPQPTRHEDFRLTPTKEGHLLEVLLGEIWNPVYEVSRTPCVDEDYLVPNAWTSTSPDSHFRNELMVARTTDAARIVLVGNRLTIRDRDGTVDRRYLSAIELESVLVDLFDLPFDPLWRPILANAGGMDESKERRAS